MTTQRHSNVLLLSFLAGIAAGAPVALAAPPIEWTIYRPSNTGILGTRARSLLVDDATGFRWLASKGGLLRCDLAAGPDSLVRFDPSNSPLPTEWVADIALAPDGTIWLAMFRVSNPNHSGGLAQYDPATGSCPAVNSSRSRGMIERKTPCEF